MKCTYDMNTGDYTLEETMYSEADIEDFELEQEIKEEEEAAQETIEPTPTVQPTENDIARRYGVMTIPTVILFKNGEEVKRNIGYMSKEELINFMK